MNSRWMNPPAKPEAVEPAAQAPCGANCRKCRCCGKVSRKTLQAANSCPSLIDPAETSKSWTSTKLASTVGSHMSSFAEDPVGKWGLPALSTEGFRPNTGSGAVSGLINHPQYRNLSKSVSVRAFGGTPGHTQ